MTQTADLIHKMAEFFKSEEFFEKGEDARLELSPDDVRCMNEIIKACGNGVSKQTVLDTISELNAVSFYEAQEDSKECYYELRQAIKDLSPVKQQERTGHWEWVQYDYNPKIGNWHCTECRCIVVECVDKNEKGGIPLYKYCPQCGAKMEVEQNG